MNIDYKINSASQEKIKSHFLKCDEIFFEQLNNRVNIEEYIKKIFKNAKKIEAWFDNDLVGLLAMYENFDNNFAFITNFSVDRENKGKGIALRLLKSSIECAEKNGFSEIKLEVNETNIAAISIYNKIGFKTYKVNGSSKFMRLHLN